MDKCTRTQRRIGFHSCLFVSIRGSSELIGLDDSQRANHPPTLLYYSMKSLHRLLAVVLLTASVSLARAQAPKPDASSAIVKADAASVPNASFIKMHQSFLPSGTQGPI